MYFVRWVLKILLAFLVLTGVSMPYPLWQKRPHSLMCGRFLHKSVSSHYNEISKRNELIKENRLICFTVSNYFKKDLDMKQQRKFLVRGVKKQKKVSVSYFPSRAYLNDLRTSTKNSIHNAPQNLTTMTPWAFNT